MDFVKKSLLKREIVFDIHLPVQLGIVWFEIIFLYID